MQRRKLQVVCTQDRDAIDATKLDGAIRLKRRFAACVEKIQFQCSDVGHLALQRRVSDSEGSDRWSIHPLSSNVKWWTSSISYRYSGARETICRILWDTES